MFFRFIIALYIGCVFVVMPAPAMAEEELTRQVRDIMVTVESGDKEMAKQVAIAEAKKQGIKKLIEFYRAPLDPETITEDTLEQLVMETHIISEKIAPKSYSATIDLTYRIGWLVPYLPNQAARAPYTYHWLIIPVLLHQADQVPVAGEHVWSKAWRDFPLTTDQPPMVIIKPEERDTLSPAQLSDQIKLSSLAASYDAEQVMVVRALQQVEGFSGRTLMKYEPLVIGQEELSPQPIALEGEFGAPTETEMQRVIATLITELQQQPEAEVQDPFYLHVVTVNPQHMEHWQEIKRRLATVDVIQRMEVEELSLHRATIKLYTALPEIDIVATEMAAKKLSLTYEGVVEPELDLMKDE